MKLALALVLAAAACGQKARPDVVPPGSGSAELRCPGYAFAGLKLTPGADAASPEATTAIQTGRQHADRGTELVSRSTFLEAAREFLACGAAFVKVPDGQPQRDEAMSNAGACFDNALSAFAMAAALGSEGRSALQKATGDAPELATMIDERLKTVKDCAFR